MGKVTGFKEYKRKNFSYAPVAERIKHYNEFAIPLDKEEIVEQSARCMDCGVPFCHSNYGCPVANIIPHFNDLIYRGKWKSAFNILMSTNNFPEFTGRICPAPCEGACVLGINEDPVNIKSIEYAIIEKAYKAVFKYNCMNYFSGERGLVTGITTEGIIPDEEQTPEIWIAVN